MDVVAMPQLGETVTEGTITAWRVAVGDLVEIDDALFEVSTEKVDTEVPSAVAGHVRAILVVEDQTVPIGTPVAVLTPGADDPLDLATLGAPAAAPAGAVDPVGSLARRTPPDAPVGSVDGPRSEVGLRSADGAQPAGAETSGAARTSPVVRRLLAEHGLDTADVAGSGRGGRITRSDVLSAVAQRERTGVGSVAGSAAVPPGGGGSNTAGAGPAGVASAGAPAAPTGRVVVGEHDEVVEFSRARSLTAAHMSRSLATTAHALVVVEVDYGPVEPVRRAAGLSYLPFVARAVVEAVGDFPHLNASVDGERLVVHRRVRLGVAVDVHGEALVVPVLHEADRLRLPALGAAVADLADRSRRRRLTGSELEGATFTLTNVGSYGTLLASPIINQPQVAILSVDGVAMKPVAVRTDPGHGEPEWGVAVHPVGNLSLAFDHRAIDGAYAAAFLARVRDVLQERPWAAEL